MEKTKDTIGEVVWKDAPAANGSGVSDHGALTGLNDDDHTQYARVAGRSGGQTLTGGTGSGDALTLSSTSHATKGRINIGQHVRFAFDEANYADMVVDSTGEVLNSGTAGTWSFRNKTDSATLGSNLITNGDFSTDLTGWTGTNWAFSSGKALHTAGSTAALTQSISVTSGSTLQVSITISGRSAGSVVVAIGAAQMVDYGATITLSANTTYVKTVVAAASGSVPFTVTPTTDFNGSVDSISVRVVSLGSNTPSLVIRDAATGAIVFEVRCNSTNFSFGTNSQRSLTTGTGNFNMGPSGQYSLTTGYNNFNMGPSGQYSLTTGNNNSNTGTNGQYSLTTGYSNSNTGTNGQYSLTTGYNNSNTGTNGQYSLTTGYNNSNTGTNGQRSLTTGSSNSNTGTDGQRSLTTGNNNSNTGTYGQYSLTTGSNNSNTGTNGQRYAADGTTPATSFDNCTSYGASNRLSAATGVTNEHCFGYGVIGGGSNTVTIGETTITKCFIRGVINQDKTITAAGTTGAQTINKPHGRVNFAAGATSLVVTNSHVDANSIIQLTIGSNDATMKSASVVAGAGSFTIYANAAPTAETAVNFTVFN